MAEKGGIVSDPGALAVAVGIGLVSALLAVWLLHHIAPEAVRSFVYGNGKSGGTAAV